MNKTRVIALTCTLVFHALVLLLLLSVYLRFNPDEKPVWPPEDTSELLLEGEYVKVGEIPLAEPAAAPSSSSAPQEAHEADDLADAGQPADNPPALTTSTAESPMKVEQKPKPETPGPTKEELEAQAKAKKQAETAGKINQRVQFGSSSSNAATSGTSGSPNGNSSTGAVSGKPGFNLTGRTLDKWSLPSGKAVGTIVIAVTVDRSGKVIKASYQSGSGAVASDRAARTSCENAARQSRFSVNEDARAEQMGTITYRFQ